MAAVNKSYIPTYGACFLTLDLGLRYSFCFVFVVADLPTPIIGADFLDEFGLFVNVRHHRLLDSTVNGIPAPLHKQSVSPMFPRSPGTGSDKYAANLGDFPDMTRPDFHPKAAKHTVTHHIVTTGPPVYSRPCCLAADRLKVLDACHYFVDISCNFSASDCECGLECFHASIFLSFLKKE